MITGQITDSMMGHLQLHRKGYVASIDNLLLNMNMKQSAYQKIAQVLKANDQVETFSPRLKFGGMFSNFTETTNIRLNGIDPEAEFTTVPLFTSRIM